MPFLHDVYSSTSVEQAFAGWKHWGRREEVVRMGFWDGLQQRAWEREGNNAPNVRLWGFRLTKKQGNTYEILGEKGSNGSNASKECRDGCDEEA